MRSITLGAVLSVTIIAACGGPTEYLAPCLAGQVPAIEVEVVDAVTRDPLTGIASGIVTNGQRTDSLRVCLRSQERVLSRCGMYGLSGTFYVRVAANGYQTWDSTGVVVPYERCGNTTTHLDVAMRRQVALTMGLPNKPLHAASALGVSGSAD